MSTLNLSPTDFDAYYREAVIKDPETKEYRVVKGVQSTDDSIFVRLAPIGINNPTGYSLTKFSKITWNHLALPENLGYRSLNGMLYYICMRVSRNTKKGFSDRTATISSCASNEKCLSILDGRAYNKYLDSVCLSKDMIEEVFDPHFVAAPFAIKNIYEGNSYGHALSPSTAIVLSSDADHIYDLLFQRVTVATSQDGKTWNAIFPELIDSITRSIGQLNYARP